MSDQESNWDELPDSARRTLLCREKLNPIINNKDEAELDKFLSLHPWAANHGRVFTDDWGEYWPPLIEVLLQGWERGADILLVHGAQKFTKSTGDPGEMYWTELEGDRLVVKRMY